MQCHNFTKLAASMMWVEGPFRAFWMLALKTRLLGKKYDKRYLKVVFCVVFHTSAMVITMARAHTQWWHIVASHEATNMLHWEMCLALYLPGGMCQNVFFCTQALYCFVYGLGWPLAISWQIGFSGKGFHIVELWAKAHFPKVNTARKSFTHCWLRSR